MNAACRCLARACLLLMLCAAAPGEAADTFNSVYISELLAENRHGLADDDGDYSGWIELRNGSAATVNLAGWYLTDNPTNLTKWRFPRVALLPDKYLVVFASGKARTNNLAHLHTNFRLDQSGGYLALVNPATNVVSEFTYAQQAADVSFGRVRDEPATRGQLARPTPGKPNAFSGPGFAPEVLFTPKGGPFTAPFTLQLSSRPTNASIRFTLDGRLPTRDSPLYTAPLLITNTAHVRARTYQEGLLPGPPRSEAYLVLHSNVLEFTSTLPLLVMHTFGKDLPTSTDDSFVHLSLFEPAQEQTSLTNPPTLTTRGGFHIRGSSSSGMPQSSFALQFLDEFNEDQNHAPLGLPADSDWVLYAPNHFEPVMIHNPFVHQLSRDMGRYSPRTRFLEVYLARHAGPVSARDYHGIYVLEEKIKIGKQRVNIDRLGPGDLQPPAVTGGYLLKIDRLGPDESGFGAAGASMVYVDPKEQVIRLPQRYAQRQFLQTFFNDFDRALHGPNWKDPVLGYPAFIDEKAWIDFHVLEVLSGNVDALNLSTFLHIPRAGKITFGPHWDFDRALGSTDGRDENPRHWNTGPYFSGAWWNKVFTDVDFWQHWVDRWQELRRTHFSLGNLYDLIDHLTDELREAQPRQVKRWGLHPRGGSYQSEIGHLKNWLSNRIDFIDRQLVQPPRLDHQGGPVAPGFVLTLTGPASDTLHYTLDGTDPRLPQGGISSNAITYTNPIPLRADSWIVVRARNPNQRQTDGPPASTPWSSPVSAKFAVTPR